jgi:hypothetical protein
MVRQRHELRNRPQRAQSHWRSANKRKKFIVARFAFTDVDVVMYWRRSAKEKLLSTQFGEFSANRRVMIQIRNEGGPRREFRRC